MSSFYFLVTELVFFFHFRFLEVSRYLLGVQDNLVISVVVIVKVVVYHEHTYARARRASPNPSVLFLIAESKVPCKNMT